MDKSFNDQELSDIMKEIEALEEDFAAAEEKKIEAQSPVLEELAELEEEVAIPFAASPKAVVPEVDEETEETLDEAPAAVVSFEPRRAAAPQFSAEPTKSAEPEKSVEPISRAHTSMSFKVQGDLTLELQFDIGGKIVSLGISESGLAIEMEGGVKFTVPITEKDILKKAV
jgi:hypothetical protein